MKIFISYARDGGCGQNLATEIQQRLQVAGFSVFRDVEGLKPGDVWYHKLEFELESSDLMVVVVSEKVRRSEWVANEVQLAREIGIPVIPVLAEKIRLPLWLRSLQHLDFCQKPDWSSLLDIIDSSKRIPDWADSFDYDAYGCVANLGISGVVQRFRLISSGHFLMGAPDGEEGRMSGEDQHEEVVKRDFWLADTACSQALWKAVMGGNPSHNQGDELNPVECVSWYEVQEFLVSLQGILPQSQFRLPTEAEWEYSCRADRSTAFSVNSGELEKINYYKSGDPKTIPVYKSLSNQWGIYQMHGNVYEWCDDLYRDYTYPVSSDHPLIGFRSVRGGSWLARLGECRSACRRFEDPSKKSADTGFRFVIDA